MRTKNSKLASRIILILTILWAMTVTEAVLAATVEALTLETREKIKSAINAQLSRYCPNACELLKVDLDIKEEATEDSDLGFEGISPGPSTANYYTDRASIEVQVDETVTRANQDRLQNVLMNHLHAYASSAEIIWKPVKLPNIGKSMSSLESLKKKLEAKLAATINTTIDSYCPTECILSLINISGSLVTMDESAELPRSQIVSNEAGDTIMRIDDINVEISISEAMDMDRRIKIVEMLRAKTRFATPLQVNASVSKFPETYAEQRGLSEDPYGLEKLRRMLILFRDLAGTKEVITSAKTESTSASSSKESTETNNSATNSSTLENKSTTSATETNSSTSESSLESKSKSTESAETTNSEKDSSDDWVMWGAIALAAILVLAIILRFMAAQKEAKAMVAASERAAANANANAAAARNNNQGQGVMAGGLLAVPGFPGAVSGAGSAGGEFRLGSSPEVELKLKVENLKEDLSKAFMQQPKVAKDTFTRMLKDDGVEFSAKYLHIFGHMIILELLDDPNLTRDLYALSEFFHKSKFNLSLKEVFDLLTELKSRFTASEIRVLSNKTSTQFDFLNKLDPPQIYNLISEEKPQVQSIVLTQLDRKRRMTVFDMYQGKSKVFLMNELCKADAIPREYLNNVAKALNKKVTSRPEYDTESFRSTDIIIDLLERSDLREQVDIMASMQAKFPDTARGIMMKLVTIEILPFMKDGHLLEIILGMDREDLVTFLGGAKDHIRNLLLSKSPPELAESWIEELQMAGLVDEQKYRIVEMKVFARIRNLAENGTINLLSVNQMIFRVDSAGGAQNAVAGAQFSRNAMVA